MIKLLKNYFFFIPIIIIFFLLIKNNLFFINKKENYIFQQKINNIIKKENIFEKKKIQPDWIDLFWIIKNKYKIKSKIHTKYEIRYNNYIYLKKIKILYTKTKFKKYIFFKSYKK